MAHPTTATIDKVNRASQAASWVTRSGTLMAWAVKQTTRTATHIGMLSRDQAGLACECACPACGGALQAVNAGRPLEHYDKPNTLRPFFRHDTGQQKDACLAKVAQIAALHLLATRQEIDLPTRLVAQTVAGATGRLYTGQAVVGAARVRVRRMDWLDEHAARITLDDGRVVLLQLAGQVVLSNSRGTEAVIIISVDDPEVSAWSPEQILQRVQLEGNWMCWQRHWDDDALARESLEAAEEQARQHLDWAPSGLVLPDGLTPQQRSETFLHWYLKDLLAKSLRLRTPAVRESVSMVMPNGREEVRHVTLPAMTLALSDVRIEHNLGDIVPDLMARAHDETGKLEAFDLLIEVAVTHPVDAAKATRIAARNVACVEIDVSLLGVSGRLTVDRLRELVTQDPNNKRWIHHPEVTRLLQRAQDELEDLASRLLEAQMRAQALEQAFDTSSDAEALTQYLERKRAIWLTGRDVTDGLPLPKMTVSLARRGYLHLEGAEFSGPTGLLRILDAIRSGSHRGRQSSHALIAIKRMEEEEPHMRFASFYLLAIKAYAPDLEAGAAERLAALRSSVVTSVRAEQTTYARPVTWDGAVSTLFPEMAAGIASGFGTTEQVDSIRKERVSDERRVVEDKERRQREAREREVRERQEQALNAETVTLIQSTARQFAWAELDGGIPMDADSAAKLAQRQSAYAGNSDWVLTNVASAWDARAQGFSLSTWIESREPQHGGDVMGARQDFCV